MLTAVLIVSVLAGIAVLLVVGSRTIHNSHFGQVEQFVYPVVTGGAAFVVFVLTVCSLPLTSVSTPMTTAIDNQVTVSWAAFPIWRFVPQEGCRVYESYVLKNGIDPTVVFAWNCPDSRQVVFARFRTISNLPPDITIKGEQANQVAITKGHVLLIDSNDLERVKEVSAEMKFGHYIVMDDRSGFVPNRLWSDGTIGAIEASTGLSYLCKPRWIAGSSLIECQRGWMATQ